MDQIFSVIFPEALENHIVKETSLALRALGFQGLQ